MSETADRFDNIILNSQQIQERIKAMAQIIQKDFLYSETLLVSVLEGSICFVASLVKNLSINYCIDFIRVSSYDGEQTSGRIVLHDDIASDIKGRDILVVEDIVDTGLTVDFVSKHLFAKGARTVKICALLDKPSRRISDIIIHYRGFEIEDKFVAGFGLDHFGRYRALPYIGEIRQ